MEPKEYELNYLLFTTDTGNAYNLPSVSSDLIVELVEQYEYEHDIIFREDDFLFAHGICGQSVVVSSPLEKTQSVIVEENSLNKFAKLVLLFGEPLTCHWSLDLVALGRDWLHAGTPKYWKFYDKRQQPFDELRLDDKEVIKIPPRLWRLMMTGV